ncbi:MAG: YbdK family carboxylate-amine ligase [Thermoleophilia bacterium]|nr:YbdK family carboxylate-amine ligase [Thermoleophilia bacterium]
MGEDPTGIEPILQAARGIFEASTDFTLGVEEEFAILDPETLDLVPEYEQCRLAAVEAGLSDAVAGELLASEIEFRTGRCLNWAQAVEELTDIRSRVMRVMHDLNFKLGASGTHPWADYQQQIKIDQPYYQRLTERLAYVADRNCTFGLHVHVGVRGAERAIKVANAARAIQPLMLALSGSSPYIDGFDSGLCSTRSFTFSRTFPRGNLAPAFDSFDAYLEYTRWLRDTGSIFTAGQVWWGVRPHLLIGTGELRMFDGQPDVNDTLALAALAQGVIAHLCDLHDADALPEVPASHLVDENLWRASRWGTDARMVKLPGNEPITVCEAVARLVEQARTASTKHELGIEAGLDRVLEIAEHGCSAVRQRNVARNSSEPLREAYEWVVAQTMGAPSPAAWQR